MDREDEPTGRVAGFTTQISGVRLTKLTGRPELAVALRMKSGSPKVLPPSGAKLIV